MFKLNLKLFMITKIIKIFILIAISCPSIAQYYYKDIISNKEATSEVNTFKQQKIRKIIVKSIEADGQPSEGFFCEKKILKDYSKIETETRSNITGASIFTSYFKNDLLYKTVDSSDIAVSTSAYEYNNNGNLIKITSVVRSSDDDFITESREDHLYRYSDKGLLEQMFRIKNDKDTTLILFSLDENKNVVIEKNTRTGSKYFYYYDVKNRLTDVVQSSDLKPQLLPDYTFEYNNAGQIAQMIATEEGNSNYLTWKYYYDNNLRIREKCYSKEKRLLGTIDYEYK